MMLVFELQSPYHSLSVPLLSKCTCPVHCSSLCKDATAHLYARMLSGCWFRQVQSLHFASMNNVQFLLCVMTARNACRLMLLSLYITRINIWCKLFQQLQVSHGTKMSESTSAANLSHNVTVSLAPARQKLYACAHLQAAGLAAHVQLHVCQQCAVGMLWGFCTAQPSACEHNAI